MSPRRRYVTSAAIPPWSTTGQVATAALLAGNHVLLDGEPVAIAPPVNGEELQLVDGPPEGNPVISFRTVFAAACHTILDARSVS